MKSVDDQLLYLIREIKIVHSSDADWKFKHDRIFGIWSKQMRPILEKEGLEIKWYGSDTPYQEGTSAFVESLEPLRANLQAVEDAREKTAEDEYNKASFLDRDPLPVYEKGVTHEFSGVRVKRGLYRSADGTVLNADVNGSANIGRKVIGNEGILLGLDRSVAATPERINPLKFFCV